MYARDFPGPRRCAALGLVLLLAGIAPARAQEPRDERPQAPLPSSAAGEPTSRAPAAQGSDALAGHGPLDDARDVLSVFWGYGVPQRINGSADIDIASAGVRWTHLFGPRGGTGLFAGRPAFGVELLPLAYFVEEGREVYSGGLHLMYEQHFARGRRVLPILRIGAGALQATDEVPAGETRFNFSLLAGLGLDLMLGRRAGLQVEYRFHHVSNANIGTINPGINAHTVLLGYTFYR